MNALVLKEFGLFNSWSKNQKSSVFKVVFLQTYRLCVCIVTWSLQHAVYWTECVFTVNLQYTSMWLIFGNIVEFL